MFLLRDVFGYGYEEIAAIVGKTEANCRQIFARARRHIDAGRPRFATSREEREELVEKFLAARERGGMEELVRLLAEDAAFYGDGGGKVAATPRPIFGRARSHPPLHPDRLLVGGRILRRPGRGPHALRRLFLGTEPDPRALDQPF